MEIEIIIRGSSDSVLCNLTVAEIARYLGVYLTIALFEFRICK